MPFSAPGGCGLTSYSITVVTEMPLALNRFLLATCLFDNYNISAPPFPLIHPGGSVIAHRFGGMQKCVKVNDPYSLRILAGYLVHC